MTSKILSGTYAAGYTITGPVVYVTVTPTGYVGGSGLTGGPGTYSYSGVYQVDNLGRIKGSSIGVYLQGGGTVTNGSTGNDTALIQGSSDGVRINQAGAAVTSFGTILATAYGGSAAVYLKTGGSVVNGESAITSALMKGGFGVRIRNAIGTVANFGTIVGTDVGFSEAVYLGKGGSVTNGSAGDTVARLVGDVGVWIRGAAGTVANFGTIAGVGVYQGVYMDTGGRVTNGTAVDTAALISGGNGVVVLTQTGTVTNFGTILADSPGSAAVVLSAGGRLTNGSGGDRTALIEGYQGVLVGAVGTVINNGTIRAVGGATDYGVRLTAGSLTNGAVNNRAALIEGYGGLQLSGVAGAVNFGTINATGGGGGVGVYLAGVGANLANGSANDATAVIAGYDGAALTGTTTLTNFGVISGASGVAVVLASSKATLVVEGGCRFDGSVTGAASILELGSGAGTISGLSGGAVTVSASMPTTTFHGFAKLRIDAGAQFTLAGNGTISVGESLTVAGTLSVGGILTVTGGLVVTGALSGAGTVAIGGGSSAFNGAAALTLAHVTVAGAATVVNVAAANLAYAGTWTQSAGTLTVAAADKVSFSGVGDSFAGTLAGAGTVALIGGADTLSAATLSAAKVTISNAAVTLAGAITIGGAVTATTPGLIVAASGASLTGGGAVSLTNLATNKISGATATATLTNVNDRITGAGDLGGGKMTLINQAGGTINGNLSIGLIIDTGAATIANAGVIENTGAGGTVIQSALANAGSLTVTAGTLAVNGPVTGAGSVKIAGGAADFASNFSENVAFTGATGVLELAHSTAYTGSISGFSKTGGAQLDLADIVFSASTKASYAGTTTSGVLTVTDGTHTAHIKLTGDYTTSTFVAATDGHGGTLIHDPSAAAQVVRLPAAQASPGHAFVAAMAGFAPAAASLGAAAEPWRGMAAALAVPRTQLV